MREIKFRAWNTVSWHKPGMVYDYQDSIYVESIGFNDPDVPIMQYTGLKDKNGKEIYEGDIVECGNMGEGIVYYDVNIGGFSVNLGTTFDCFIDYAELVIGNIHENPELL